MSAPERIEPIRDQFIDFWGQMASRWGVSKTMAQVYALLYSSPDALHTDHIMDRLGISRGNANMNLHKLMDWGMVTKQPQPDTRKDYFVAEKDVWNLTLNIIRHRQELELEPLRQPLQEMVTKLERLPDPTPAEAEFRQHLEQMVQFNELFFQLTAALLPLLRHRSPQQVLALVQAAQQAAQLPH